MSFLRKILQWLFAHRDISGLVVFRITLGAVMLWEVVRYFESDWIRYYFIEPKFHCTFKWFEWVRPLNGDGMYILFYLLGILSVLIIVGLFYRLALILFFLGFLYIFLIEQAIYLNHFYLILLISFLMIFIPANGAYSFDSWIWPKIRSNQVPLWTYALLRFQIGVVYFFGGLAKINYDWLIHAEPMRHWLSVKTDYPFIGAFFVEIWCAYFMSWAGMFLDLLAPILMSARRTRPFVFMFIIIFHLMNDRLFRIGIFPWFMILSSTIFFPSDWPKRLAMAVKENHKHMCLILAGAIFLSCFSLYFRVIPAVVPFLAAALGGAVLVWAFIDSLASNPITVKSRIKRIKEEINAQPIIGMLVIAWVLIQVVVPFRHFFIPGNVHWTDQGYLFAWQMMLTDKRGDVDFYAYDPVAKNRFHLEMDLSDTQLNHLRVNPQMILQYAKYLKEDLKNRDVELMGMDKQRLSQYQICAKANISLNFRPPMLLIDTTIDLTQQTYSAFCRNNWIILHDNLYDIAPLPIK